MAFLEGRRKRRDCGVSCGLCGQLWTVTLRNRDIACFWRICVASCVYTVLLCCYVLPSTSPIGQTG